MSDLFYVFKNLTDPAATEVSRRLFQRDQQRAELHFYILVFIMLDFTPQTRREQGTLILIDQNHNEKGCWF